jgi:hypothetical protein
MVNDKMMLKFEALKKILQTVIEVMCRMLHSSANGPCATFMVLGSAIA